MMKNAMIAAVALLGSTNAVELTPDTYDAATAGKTVFLKFFAPWCGHCKKMAPDWNTLMKEYEGNDKILVADVDCTAAGKPLCEANGVKGFPTLKFGDPTALEDYSGGRDAAAITKFASELKPKCSPANLDLCDAEERAEIDKVMALSEDELKAKIAELDSNIKIANANFETELAKLQATYKTLQENKEKAVEDAKAAGLGLYKAVLATKGKAAAKEEL